MQPPAEGQIVFVEGGVAQYRNGEFFTGMEDPRYGRPIQWEVKWWLPIHGTESAIRSKIQEALIPVRELLAEANFHRTLDMIEKAVR